MKIARILVVAGSDSGGGAGIQADLKTITALGGYGASAITALTAQDTCAVHEILAISPAWVRLQMRVVFADIGADAIKIGMLGNAGVIEAVANTLESFRDQNLLPPIIVDPVMVAKGGAPLLDPNAVETLRKRLLPLATLVTPNVPEAEALLARPIEDATSMEKAARELGKISRSSVFLKGGHLHRTDGQIVDFLFDLDNDIVQQFSGSRIDTSSTHGTGCSLASAIAVGLAQGMSLAAAGTRARYYVRRALQMAPGFGSGAGPLHHGIVIDWPSDLNE